MCKHRRMSSHDDPEARIRDLERSLSEQSSELTRASWEGESPAYRPPPPPPGHSAPHQPYGMPYQPTTTPAGGAGRGWILWVVMAAVVAAIIGGAIAFFVNVFSTVGPVVETFGRSSTGSSTVSSGGGPFDVPPSRSGGNRPPAPTVVPVPPAGGDISVSGVGSVKTITCNDSVVNVSGVNNRIVITGQCASVTVSGVENTVTVESSVQISASGMSNRVTYLSGTPVIDNSGSSNTVEHG